MIWKVMQTNLQIHAESFSNLLSTILFDGRITDIELQKREIPF